jgi:IS30 family transposase
MVKYQRLTLRERIHIEKYIQLGLSKTEIADKLKRHKSTISREINRWGQKKDYNCALADWCAIDERTKYRSKKILSHTKLCTFVLDHWRLKWSPEQISNKLKKLHPTEPNMQISHESIYTYICVVLK